MTDTETPIEAGARALHDRTYAGLDVGLWERRTDAGRERFLGDARAVFGSVDVEGLAGVLTSHGLRRPTAKLAYLRAATVTRECYCGHTLRPQFFEWRHYEEYDAHVAEAVVAWLTGPQEHEHRWISNRTYGDRGGFETQSCAGCPATREERS